MLEQANEFKLSLSQLTQQERLHLGHARGAAVGDSLCNILEKAGFDVEREYYINDAGNQINNLTLSLEARYFQALGLRKRQCQRDGYHGQDIIGFGKQLG